MFIGVAAVVIGFAVIIMLANTLLQSPLYYRSLEKSMTESISQLAEVDFSSERSVWLEDVYNISAGNSFDIVIRHNQNVIFSSSIDIGLREYPDTQNETEPFSPMREPKPVDPFRPLNEDMEWKETGENIFVGYSTDPRNNNEFILCNTQNDAGFSIFLAQPVEPLDAGIKQSNQLLLICTAVMLVVSVLLALVFSKGFTRPIKEIKEQVGKLSNLDFSGQLQIVTGDELEGLSNDVNLLADKLKGALDELKEKNQQLKNDIIAQRSFISNASHELRTPLSLIKGYADELNSGFVNDAESRKTYLEIISEESTKLNRLLNEMLDLSRLESGRMEINREPIRINELVMSFIEKYSGFIKERKLDVQLDLGEECTCIHDAMRVEQIMANYFSNAAKYSDERKKIIISTKTIEENVRISIFNHGENIEEEALKRIWDGFYKASNSGLNDSDSYGLGLSIVKAIQTLAGQSYGAVNHDDGVEFWFDAGLDI